MLISSLLFFTVEVSTVSTAHRKSKCIIQLTRCQVVISILTNYFHFALCVMANFLSSKTPRPFAVKLLSSQLASEPVLEP